MKNTKSGKLLFVAPLDRKLCSVVKSMPFEAWVYVGGTIFQL